MNLGRQEAREELILALEHLSNTIKITVKNGDYALTQNLVKRYNQLAEIDYQVLTDTVHV